MIQTLDKPNGRKAKKPECQQLWPERMKLSTAAAMLDMTAATFRPVAYVLAANYGLTIHQVCGQRVDRTNLLAVLDRLTAAGKLVRVDRSAGVVTVGDDEYPIKGFRQRKGVHHGQEQDGVPGT